MRMQSPKPVSRCRRVAGGLIAAVTISAAALPALAGGGPPVPPPPPAAEYPPDPNDPDPPKPKAAVVLPPADPAQVATGSQLFKDFCQKCHGIDMVSPGPPFFDLRTFPHDDKPRFVDSVTHGKRAMPAWGGVIKPAEIESLWAYVSSYKQP